MTQKRFQSIMAIAIVVYHIGVLALVAFLWARGFGGQEFITTYSVVIPFLAAFVTLAVNHVIANMTAAEDTSKVLSVTFILVTSVLPGACGVALVLVILMKYWGEFTSETFTGALGVVESGLGLYAGMLLRSLFNQPAPTTG